MQPTNIIGESSAVAEALDHLSQLAGINRPVLVLGERGTGKELAAERLHFLSPRWDGPFVRVNCAAMAETLLESELFGHEAGAFTGATKLHVGRFERADGGTLLLDEIGTTSPRLQEKLLRLIEYGEFERVGGQKTIRVDVRVVGATNADLKALVESGEFRADLLDRLSFDVVHMPALRHRDRDVHLLAEHFALRMSAELGWPLFPGFSETALTALTEHPWPGNVRELKNAIERSLHRWGDAEKPVDEIVIDPFVSPFDIVDDDAPRFLAPLNTRDTAEATPAAASSTDDYQDDDGPPLDFSDQVESFERALVSRALSNSAGNQKQAAEQLGLSYDQLRGLVRKYDLSRRKRRSV
ncbi:MAG: phage shock protein operon transcriptional activator [Pseudomonadota bacterium]